MKIRETQVGIIGAGPAGLTLALMLHKAGIRSVVLERRSREYVENRVRAGLLEQNTVEVFESLGVADRLHREGILHRGCSIHYNGLVQRIDFEELVGRSVAIYAQQEVVKDLIAACLDRQIPVCFEAAVTSLSDLDTAGPILHFLENGEAGQLNTAFIAGCDGFHGISRQALEPGSFNEYRIEYPFSWLGILAYSRPVYDELIYAYHHHGFALASMRSEKISRLYLQVANDENLENWSDKQIWDELETRLGIQLDRGEIFEKSVTPMRSFMIDKMQQGRLFLAGDSAHIVPPTGAKGLNLAVADVHNLAVGLIGFFEKNDPTGLEKYTERCLRRIWRVQDFSNFMTYLCHKQAETGSFEQLLQQSKFEYLRLSEAYRKTIAENYAGLPFEVFNH